MASTAQIMWTPWLYCTVDQFACWSHSVAMDTSINKRSRIAMGTSTLCFTTVGYPPFGVENLWHCVAPRPKKKGTTLKNLSVTGSVPWGPRVWVLLLRLIGFNMFQWTVMVSPLTRNGHCFGIVGGTPKWYIKLDFLLLGSQRLERSIYSLSCHFSSRCSELNTERSLLP